MRNIQKIHEGEDYTAYSYENEDGTTVEVEIMDGTAVQIINTLGEALYKESFVKKD